MNNQRNLLLAVVLSALLLLGWDAAVGYLYPAPPESAAVEGLADTPGEMAAVTGADSGALEPGTGVVAPVDVETALAGGNRVRIDAPRVAGSIDLATGTVDDIVLKDYRESTAEDSDFVRLFSPEGTPGQNFAQFGFLANGERAEGGAWQADGAVLSPETPVTLRKRGENGLVYTVRLSIDDEYMITAEQRVDNTGEGAAVVQPFALINRTSRTATPSTWIAHSGPVGVFDDAASYDWDYDDVAEEGTVTPEGRAAWLGFTDSYWLSALVPGGGAADTAFRSLGNDDFRADVIYDPTTLAGGRALERETRLFVGAKESVVLDQYQDAGISQFGLAISWGWFWFIEKPLLWLLRNLFELVGNFGVAIILLTVIVRAFVFPIAQRGFASMAAMKAIQPDMKKIQERYKDDKVKAQQEIQKLFKDQGVNPLAGCLPMLLQIPIFFALYKVLILAVEMRHREFLYIKDLSAPDPATILNLFGLLPFDPPGFLSIGVLAVMLGFTMWLTFKLNPSAMDPIQQQIFNIMPWVLMFVMAPFAAGLLLYWNTSNILTLAQQKYLYSKHPGMRAMIEKEREEKARAHEKAKAEAAKG
ncbi:membrane protein insertase YidC [Qipengyuania sp. MTN3-11]|uniref:membrane protein insertase YidC n=1 Tax=Qipengyuania sp. MTN3-11 TaxID=3056557 RepID=UPI0036F27C47